VESGVTLSWRDIVLAIAAVVTGLSLAFTALHDKKRRDKIAGARGGCAEEIKKDLQEIHRSLNEHCAKLAEHSSSTNSTVAGWDVILKDIRKQQDRILTKLDMIGRRNA